MLISPFLVTTVIAHNEHFQEFSKVIDTERQDPAHEEADAFILAIFSHGQLGSVKSADGQCVGIHNISEMFDCRHCPALIGKPKLLLIQACQGGGCHNREV